MLRWRLISAAVILSGLLGLLYLDFSHPLLGATGLWLVPLVLLAATLTASEVLDLLRSADLHPIPWSVYGGTLMVATAACVPTFWQAAWGPYPANCPVGQLGWPMTAMALSVGLVFLAEMRRYEQPGGVLVRVALALLAIAYAGLLLSFLVSLRLFYDHRWGMAALVSLILIVKMSDTGAYTCGRLFGRHKLAPVLSPGKTVEGAVGGIVAGCLVSWMYFAWIVPWLLGPGARTGPAWGWLLYGLIVTLAGMLGDLAESLMKRDVQRKDSSSWLPGLGGVLDILDSLLMSAAPAYICWAAGLVGPGGSPPL